MPFFNFGKLGKKSTLGIDIGTASVKFVELSKEAGRFRLENYGLFELESATAAPVAPNEKSGALSVFDQQLVWGIKQTIERSKFSGREAVASIPSFSAFSTVITMPYLSEQDIAKTIPYEARKYVPIPLDQVVLDWSIINVTNATTGGILGAERGLGPNPAGGNKAPTVEVFMVAVPKEEAKRYQNIMKQAGLNPRALEIENSALIRALVGNDLSPLAIINIGGRSTSILIVENGFERVSHNYEVGGFEITKAIAQALGVSLKRAEELKRNLRTQQSNEQMIIEAMSSLVDLIVFETKKTVHNYEDIRKLKIGRVLLVGGLVNMPVFVDYFSTKLGLAVMAGNPLARVVYPLALETIKTELNSTFAVALGLAMREV